MPSPVQPAAAPAPQTALDRVIQTDPRSRIVRGRQWNPLLGESIPKIIHPEAIDKFAKDCYGLLELAQALVTKYNSTDTSDVVKTIEHNGETFVVERSSISYKIKKPPLNEIFISALTDFKPSTVSFIRADTNVYSIGCRTSFISRSWDEGGPLESLELKWARHCPWTKQNKRPEHDFEKPRVEYPLSFFDGSAAAPAASIPPVERRPLAAHLLKPVA